jgi:GT2 family glycosyltransferase
MQRLLTSIQDQSYHPDQIVIVDGGEVLINDIIAGFASLHIDYLRMPTSLTEARNQGIRLLKPDITHVGFLDDDIVFEHDSLEAMLSFWRNASSEIGGMGFNITNIVLRSNMNFLKWPFFLIDRREGAILRSGYDTFYTPLKKNTYVDWLLGGAAIWRREVLSEFRFDEWYEGYAFMEDIDFSYRVAKKNKLVIVAGARVKHLHAPGERVHGYIFGQMQMINRYYFVKKNPELSVILFLWACIGRTLGNFLIAILYSNKTFLFKSIGNMVGLCKIMIWNIKGFKCSPNMEAE